jgi:hypothetical protein
MEGTNTPGATEGHRESIRLCKDRVVKLNSKVIFGGFLDVGLKVCNYSYLSGIGL